MNRETDSELHQDGRTNPDRCGTANPFYNHIFSIFVVYLLQLLAMDVSAWTTMKDAANCDKRCEWQNSANQKNAERILHFQVLPGSMSTSGRQRTNAPKAAL